MFVDSSALIAIQAQEPEAGDFAARIEAADLRHTSGLVVLETVMRLSSLFRIEPAAAERALDAALIEAGITLLPIDSEATKLAITAFAAFGKGRHPARLNLADCMAYGCAKAHGLPLLFKGEDFSRTDIIAA